MALARGVGRVFQKAPRQNGGCTFAQPQGVLHPPMPIAALDLQARKRCKSSIWKVADREAGHDSGAWDGP